MAHNFTVYADYHQFYVEDAQTDAAQSAAPEFWRQEAFERGLAVARDMIAVGTARYGNVQVEVEIPDAEPDANLDAWDQVNECSIKLHSGTLLVRGCTQEVESAQRFEVTPGTYRVRVFYGNLDTDDPDAEDGDDHYRVVLWPGEAIAPRVLKNYNVGDAQGGDADDIVNEYSELE
jgi:hypothetical protein